MKTKTLWYTFIAIIVICFSILGFYGHEIYREKPPIPKTVISEGGTIIFTEQEIMDGQNVWQSIGGQEVGTVWGHGAYVAPDWSADWLHRETLFLLDRWSQKDFGKQFDNLPDEQQAMLKVRLKKTLRANTFDSKTGILTVSDERAEAIRSNCLHYQGLFMSDPSLDKERTSYAIPVNSIKNQGRMDKMNAFFFWAAWACTTNRPGSEITYTNNWPPDQVIGNTP